jgi:phosphatidylglycerol:prolipoprotein diacylglycerol transferase
MQPILFELGGTPSESYLVMTVIAWAVGGTVFYKEFKRLAWPLETMLFVMAGCMFGAAIGSVIFSLLFLDWHEIGPRLRATEFVGRTVIGGIIGGYVGVELTKWRLGYKHSTGDAFAVAIPIGHVFGRIGCLLGGCCFGTLTDSALGVTYPPGSPAFLAHAHAGLIDSTAAASLAVHPAPLYDGLFDLLLFAVLWSLRDRFLVRGQLFRIYLAAYAGARFILEFWRGDFGFPDAGGPKPVQVLLLLAAIYYSVKVWWTERKAQQALEVASA